MDIFLSCIPDSGLRSFQVTDLSPASHILICTLVVLEVSSMFPNPLYSDGFPPREPQHVISNNVAF